jgi:hypothetical protein
MITYQIFFFFSFVHACRCCVTIVWGIEISMVLFSKGVNQSTAFIMGWNMVIVLQLIHDSIATWDKDHMEWKTRNPLPYSRRKRLSLVFCTKYHPKRRTTKLMKLEYVMSFFCLKVNCSINNDICCVINDMMIQLYWLRNCAREKSIGVFAYQ